MRLLENVDEYILKGLACVIFCKARKWIILKDSAQCLTAAVSNGPNIVDASQPLTCDRKQI
jgi:hypothetical protein